MTPKRGSQAAGQEPRPGESMSGRRPPLSGGARPWREGLSEAVVLGLAAGFYLWILRGPRPADPAIMRTTQKHLLAGLPLLVLVAQFGGLAVAIGLGGSPASRTWRARLALASCGLYLAGTFVAIGDAALVLAVGCVLAWLMALQLRDETPRGSAALLTLHAGALGTALAFFHQWARYRSGWEPFFQNLAALKKLWLS